MAGPIRLFAIGQRGVDVVNKPQDLDESELVSAQNCEIATSGGGGALDQRPGMTRIGNSPTAGAVLMAMDIASQLLTDLTAWLYAGLFITAAHNWRASSDGVTWVNDDTLAKPASVPFAVPATVTSLIVAGGGGGGKTAGGGGGGGDVATASDSISSTGAFSVVVGISGTGSTSSATNGVNGGDSSFNGHSAFGGGGGASGVNVGSNGGSGGGGASQSPFTGGSATGLGHAGGLGDGTGPDGGGGGSTAAIGGNANGGAATGGTGGAGTSSSITGAAVLYGAGGGGAGTTTAGPAGDASGGAGSIGTANASDAPANRGGGGGGARNAGGGGGNGGAGGSGVVIISYTTGTLVATGGSITTAAGKTIHTFTASGTWTITSIMGNAVVAAYKGFTRAARIGRYLYFVDNHSPIQVHQFDGTTDTVLSSIPPAVSGTTLSTPLVSVSGGFDGVMNGTTGATTYTYKFVAISGSSHSAASAGLSITNGNATLDSSNYIILESIPNSGGVFPSPVQAASSFDVYRTAGGATQGKIGSIPVTGGNLSLGNGTGVPSFPFTDGGLVADGTTAPTSASGATAGGAIAVLDMLTDGTSLFLAVLDTNNGGSSAGRILELTPSNRGWLQILGEFPLVATQGAPGTLAFYDGALNYGTYIAADTGKSAAVSTTGTPLPAGGVIESHTTAANVVPTAMVMFQGNLYIATAFITSGTAAVVLKRIVGVWSTARTGPATASGNAYTSLGVFNGRLYAGWTSGDGATAARIESTPDGVNWTLEFTAATTESPGQMAEFSGNFYVSLGLTGAGYVTTSRTIKRTSGGTWSEVDNPSDDLCGCLAVVYK